MGEVGGYERRRKKGDEGGQGGLGGEGGLQNRSEETGRAKVRLGFAFDATERKLTDGKTKGREENSPRHPNIQLFGPQS